VADTIEVRGLRILGCHGVLDEERVRAQPFEIDLDLEVDLRPAGTSDSLADTVDYGAVAESVTRVVQGEHSDLLEHLAERIARAAVVTAAGVSVAGVSAVTVAVRKLRPPVPADMASAGVRIHRRREDLL
jgi:dihydroneopterin aldolase